MSRQNQFRLAHGGRIDRSAVLPFTFDGRRYSGYGGDTLASALLANGVRVVARSFKFHRPRGILTAGIEEPNALVTAGAGEALDPNVRATTQPLYAGLVARSQSGWPSLQFDLGRVTDALSPLFLAGFYNKTFLWPGWRFYRAAVRRAASHAPAPTQPDGDRYESRNANVDVLVVGAGAAGMLAALAAARAGARVLLVEQDCEVGGSLLWNYHGSAMQPNRCAEQIGSDVRGTRDVTVLTRTTAVGVYDHGLVLLHERVTTADQSKPGKCRERLWRVRAKQLILACGAIEQPLVFPDNDRPGVMLAAAVRQYVNRYAVIPGRRAVLFTNNDDAYRTVFALLDAGAAVNAVLDTRAVPPPEMVRALSMRGVRLVSQAAIRAVRGFGAVAGVEFTSAGAHPERVECDLLAISSGFAPTLHLLGQARGKLRFDAARGCLIPQTVPAGIHVVGSATGVRGAATTWPQAIASGIAAAQSTGHERPVDLQAPRGSRDEASSVERLAYSSNRRRARAWVDFAHDVTARDIDIAVLEGFTSVEHLKRYTTTGMACDQGKTSNLNALTMLAAAMNRSLDETGTTTFRPPFAPVTLGALAAGRTGRFLQPVRELPAHAQHVALGARFEELGGWLRPTMYPRAGEGDYQAVAREARAVRNSLGLFDASSLGKILVRGPDAAEFLHRIYLNNIHSLAVGRVRYGLMLNERGVIIDDGICARLTDSEFWVGTTSAAAGRISGWLEQWLQCEWNDLRVAITPVTSQWATVTLAGPRSRSVMTRLCPNVDFSPSAFPHMHARCGALLGVECRIFRVSFTGEPSYEISVPADYGSAVWQALLDAGAPEDVVPFGTEALGVLRVEKGYIHVGADTDGTTLPTDIGLGEMVNGKVGDFVGRRSLSLPENVRHNRLQLVGIETVHARDRLRAGAHVVASGGGRCRRASQGYITSACGSPTLGRDVALGLVAAGRARRGEVVTIFDSGKVCLARIVALPFYDPSGVRFRD